MSESSRPDVIRLENESLEVTVFPASGAKILDFIHRSSGQNFLWRNPRIAPAPYPIEANFDNYWCGGWDDAFPTCEACTHNGESYPNLGELRSIAWRVDTNRPTTDNTLFLSAFGPISPVRAQKTIRLVGQSLEVSFTINHVGFAPIDFLWGTHPAVAIEPGCVLHIPARRGIVGQANTPLLGTPGQEYRWPILETTSGPVDMSRAMLHGQYAAGHYAADLTAGWYAIEFPHRRIGVLFEFPLEVCPYLWLWLSYGGWRGYYVAIAEPWTSMPVTLSEAVSARTHRVLRPGEQFSCQVRATPWDYPVDLRSLLALRGLAGT